MEWDFGAEAVPLHLGDSQNMVQQGYVCVHLPACACRSLYGLTFEQQETQISLYNRAAHSRDN